MKKLLIGLSVLIVLFLSACAPTVPMAPSSKDSIAKSFKKDKKYANVYLCRNSFLGSIENMPVFVDGKLAGRTNAYSFFHWKMKPGKHIIESRSSANTFTLTLNTKAYTNYFILQQPKFAKVELEILDKEKGKECVLATKMLKSQLHISSYEKKTSLVEPTYVPPVKYEKYTCKRISEEIEKINQRALPLAKKLKDADINERSMVSIGPIFALGAAISSSASEDEKVELSKLNGEYNALKTVAKQKKCKFASTL